MPRISILIPVYNVERYLRECLNSAIEQSEKDLEIICVDDASTDGSLEILEEYEKLDKRIKLLKHKTNKGLCQTRKDAVILAKGDFIMFLDSDDYISPYACENLYMEITRENVDVVQFDTELLPNASVSKDMVDWVADFMKPSLDRIETPNLLRTCFIEKKINVNLVNKIWDTKLCKKAYNRILDGYYFSAEDRYASFVLFYFATSYVGVPDKYYYYRLGIGITGGNFLDLKRFESRCKGAFVVKSIDLFLQEENEKEKFGEEQKAFKNDILLDCVDCWYNKLERKDNKQGYELLLKYWGVDGVLGIIGERYFEKQKDIFLRCTQINDYVVAIYYRYIGYEGMDSIIRHYINYLEGSGYSIYLITDQDAPEENDTYMGYPLVHIYPATDANWKQYIKRCRDINSLVIEKKFRKVYYLSPTSHVVKLDELTINSARCDTIVCMDEYLLDQWNNDKTQMVKKYTHNKKDIKDFFKHTMSGGIHMLNKLCKKRSMIDGR